MSQTVIIKSTKNGINLILDPELPFPELLDEILRKFRESEKFFANASFAISFDGRILDDEEECRIVDEIMAQTRVKILCIIENDEIRDAIIQKKLEDQRRREQESLLEAALPARRTTGAFYHAGLAAGERLETDESIVILGDVPVGASVVSASDVVVLGSLQGSAFAGMDGNPDAFIAALEFLPEQYNIGGIYGNPIEPEKNGLFSKRNKTPQAKLATACDGIINIRVLP